MLHYTFSKGHCYLSRVHLPHFDCLEKYQRDSALGWFYGVMTAQKHVIAWKAE
jgi:hypothetical protein